MKDVKVERGKPHYSQFDKRTQVRYNVSMNPENPTKYTIVDPTDITHRITFTPDQSVPPRGTVEIYTVKGNPPRSSTYTLNTQKARSKWCEKTQQGWKNIKEKHDEFLRKCNWEKLQKSFTDNYALDA